MCKCFSSTNMVFQNLKKEKMYRVFFLSETQQALLYSVCELAFLVHRGYIRKKRTKFCFCNTLYVHETHIVGGVDEMFCVVFEQFVHDEPSLEQDGSMKGVPAAVVHDLHRPVRDRDLHVDLEIGQ